MPELLGIAALIIVAAALALNRKSINRLYQPNAAITQRSSEMSLLKQLKRQVFIFFHDYPPDRPKMTFEQTMIASFMDAAQPAQSVHASNAPAMHDAQHAMQPAPRPMQPIQHAYAPPMQPVHDACAWLGDAQPQVQSIKLSTLVDADNVLVAGPKGSGKTTLLRTLVHARASEELIALDPHASPGKWPCICIGGGLRWNDISTALQRMQRDMQMRFEDLASGAIGEGEFRRRSYVGDEWLTINQELDGKAGSTHAGKLLISRLTQGRKVGECILVAAQNDTVESLGIQGNSDLKGCFDYICYLGSLVSSRAKYHGCPPDIIEAAKQAERVGVVWHPERNNWYVLIFDLEPVKEGQVVTSTAEPLEPSEPVRPDGAVLGSSNQFANQFDHGSSSGSTHQEAVRGGSALVEVNERVELVRELVRAGKTGNQIRAWVKGTDSDILALVKQAKQELGLVDAA